MQLPSRKTLFLLFIFSAVIKLATILYFDHLNHCYHGISVRERGLIASIAGDTPTYLEPIDNYIEKGEFYFTNTANNKVPIGRGPFYGIPYFLFRLFFNKTIAANIYAFFQLFLDSLSILYYCALTAAICGKLKSEKLRIKSEQLNHTAFHFSLQSFFLSPIWLAYILFNISFYITVWDGQLWTESLHISFFGFFAYHYYNYVTTRKTKSFIYSALFLAFITLIKPYFVLLYLGVGIELLFSMSFGKALKRSAIFSIPLLAGVIPWTIRNWVKYDRIVSIQELYTGYPYTPATFAYWNFVTAWGGSVVHWDKRSAGCYFEPFPDEECEYTFPSYVFTKQYSMKDIEDVRNDFVRYQRNNKDKALEDTVVKKFNRLTSDFKKEKPFFYYVAAPFLCAKKMIFHSGSYYMPVYKKSPCYSQFQMFLKGSQSALYYLLLIFGWWGLIKLMRKRETVLCASIPFFLILFFCFWGRATEFRYFDTTYAFFIVGFVYFIQKDVLEKVKFSA